MGLPYVPTLIPQTTPGLIGIYTSPMERLGYSVDDSQCVKTTPPPLIPRPRSVRRWHSSRVSSTSCSSRPPAELRENCAPPRGFLFLYYPYQHPPVTTSTLPTKVSRGDLLEGAGMFIDPYRVNRLTCCSSAP